MKEPVLEIERACELALVCEKARKKDENSKVQFRNSNEFNTPGPVRRI